MKERNCSLLTFLKNNSKIQIQRKIKEENSRNREKFIIQLNKIYKEKDRIYRQNLEMLYEIWKGTNIKDISKYIERNNSNGTWFKLKFLVRFVLILKRCL